MGLQSQLSDCWSESIPILAVAIVASFVGYLRSLTFNNIFTSMRISEEEEEVIDDIDDGFMKSIASGQLQLNRIYSRRYGTELGDCGGGDCVFCLSSIRKGENVRTLACRHVFHKRCLDGWLECFQFSCPLCRSPFIPEKHVGTAFFYSLS